MWLIYCSRYQLLPRWPHCCVCSDFGLLSCFYRLDTQATAMWQSQQTFHTWECAQPPPPAFLEKYQGLQIAACGCCCAHSCLFVINILSIKMSAEMKSGLRLYALSKTHFNKNTKCFKVAWLVSWLLEDSVGTVDKSIRTSSPQCVFSMECSHVLKCKTSQFRYSGFILCKRRVSCQNETEI